MKSPNKGRNRWIAGALAAVLIAGGLFAWWAVARADRQMRADLVQQARLVAQAVNTARVQALSGTATDLDSSDYRQLKEQLIVAGSTNPQCHFVYLLGRGADGVVFFFLDSEPAGSEDYSSPGQVYDEVSADCRRVFDTKAEAVKGPVTDQKGVWVSALVPLIDPRTGTVVAVLGMDTDARAWKSNVAARAATPAGLMLALLIGAAAVFVFARRRVDASPKPVLRRLLPALAVTMILLIAGEGALLWQQQRHRLAEKITVQITAVSRELRVDLGNQTAGLVAAAQPIAANPGVKKALRAGNAAGLLAAWQPVFEALRQTNNLTQFSFFDASRVCLLRVHDPEKRGDRIERFTAREAERTGTTASGIELGPLGAFSLRVVQPVFDADMLVGYVELGKQIEDMLQARRDSAALELAVTVYKKRLDRQTWEEGMRQLGREADWDRLRQSVVVYASQGRLPDAFASWAGQSAGGFVYDETDREIAFNGKDWRVSAAPLQDASSAKVGDLLVMRDISAEKAAFARLMALFGMAGALLLALLLSFIYVLLRRTDAGIRSQQAELRESKERIEATLSSIGDGVIACDAEGNVTGLNPSAEALTGWSAVEAQGRPIAEIFRIVDTETRQEREIPVGRALREGVVVALANHTALMARDGAEHQVADSCAPIHDAAGAVIGAVLVFRDVTEEHGRRERLRESEEKHRLLFVHSDSGIAVHQIVLDAAGQPVDYVYLSANPAFETHTGLRVADILGRRATEVFPGTGAPFIEIYGTVARTGEPTRFEVRFEPLRRHFLINAYQVGEGRFATVFTDSTERKRAEEEIKGNESRLRILADILQHPSETVQDFLDHALDQAIHLTGSGIGFIYHYHADRKEFVLNTWSRDVMAACTVVEPRTCYALDKTGIWGEAVRQRRPIIVNDFASAHPLKKGFPEGHVQLTNFLTVPIFRGDVIVGVVGLANKESDYVETDVLQVSLLMEAVWKVTERMQAEEALRENEERMRAVMDAANDAILMMDNDGNVSYWNLAAERILGYMHDEAMGMNLHELIVPERFHAAHKAAYPEFKQSGRGDAIGKTHEVAARRKDGLEFDVSLSLSAVKIKGAWHAIGIIRDITERKKAEEALRETNRALEEATVLANEMAVQAEMASQAKSEFLANMSHEIRTPMNGVVGMTGLLLDTELDDEQRRYAEIVRASGESLLGLINDILDFSKIEAKKLELEELDFDLSGLLEDFAATLAVRAHEKGLELICAAEPGVPTLLRGDPGRLRQILVNLAGNAVKFTPAGEVAVRAWLVEEKETDVLLRFSVRDTGIGIPHDKLGLLFAKFSQVDASTTRRYGGTGLGLAISKQLAELMGGEVGVESKEGRGSEFWFTAHLGKQAQGEAVQAHPSADLHEVRVLIVDDNATNREILSTRLASWGMRPTEALGAPQALRALFVALEEKDPYRIAIIDMQMPGMDGESLGRAIKAEEPLADTRMVMLTSLGTRGDARHFQEIGFSAYATKPIRHQELKAVLSLALGKGEGTEGSAPTMQQIATRHTARETLKVFAGCKARILLAEDNITNQQVALGIMKKLGLRADAVADGAEALKALASIPYDLVLMDVQMPVMDGPEATRRIRNPRSAVPDHGIPIIAMTAHAMQGDRERCLEAGMNDYLTKPVSPQGLAEALEKWLPREDAAASASPPRVSATRGVEAPVFDKAGMLGRLMGDEELARRVGEGFLQDIPRQMEGLRGFLGAGDAGGAERQAHTIKGASATVGGEALRGVASRMEKAARAGDLSGAAGYMAELETQFDRLKKAMTKGEHLEDTDC